MTSISMTHPLPITAPSPRSRRGAHRANTPPYAERIRRWFVAVRRSARAADPALAGLTALMAGALAAMLLIAIGVIA